LQYLDNSFQNEPPHPTSSIDFDIQGTWPPRNVYHLNLVNYSRNFQVKDIPVKAVTDIA